jgi:hypothetical protein
MKQKKDANLPLRVPSELRQNLENLADLQGSNLTDICIEALNAYVENNKNQLSQQASEAINKIGDAITIFEAERDYGIGLNKEQEQYYNCLWFCHDLLARTDLLFNDPLNHVPDPDPDPEFNGKPTYKYCRSANPDADEIIKKMKPE